MSADADHGDDHDRLKVLGLPVGDANDWHDIDHVERLARSARLERDLSPVNRSWTALVAGADEKDGSFGPWRAQHGPPIVRCVDDHDSEVERLKQVIENQSALLALTLDTLEQLGFPLEGLRELMLD